MTKQQINSTDARGFSPLMLVTLLAIRDSKYLEAAKTMLYFEGLKIKCPGPIGWTPLQEAIYYVLKLHKPPEAYSAGGPHLQSILYQEESRFDIKQAAEVFRVA